MSRLARRHGILARYSGAALAALLLVLAGSAWAAPGRAATAGTPALDADRLLARLYDQRAGLDVHRAEREFIPMLARRSTRSEADTVLRSLKPFMINAVFQHDRKTYFCNKLAETWADDENPVGKALAICPLSFDTSQNLCQLFYYRLPVLRRLMANFAALYSDDRLAMTSDDVRYWHGLLSCESAEAGSPPAVRLRYMSDLLVEFTDRARRGLDPYDTARAHDVSEFEQVTMGRYYFVLHRDCALRPRADENLLRTMECRAVGLREQMSNE